MKMYVITHKEISFLPKDRTLIGVGNKKINDVTIYDNVDDNIAVKNSSFCELTALYWIYRNDDSEIVSFEHYRRFFIKYSSMLKPRYIRKNAM